MRKYQLLIFIGFVVVFFFTVIFLFYDQHKKISESIQNTASQTTPTTAIAIRNYLHDTPLPPKKLAPLGNSIIIRDTIVNALSANGFLFLKDTEIDATDRYYGGQDAYTMQQPSSGTIVTIVGSTDNIVKVEMTIPLNSITNYDIPFNNIIVLENTIDPEMIHWLYITYQNMVQKLQTNQISGPLQSTITVNSIFYTLSLANQSNKILTLSLQSAQ